MGQHQTGDSGVSAIAKSRGNQNSSRIGTVDGTDAVSWAEVTMGEGTDSNEGHMHSDAWPVGVGLVFCGADKLGTKVLVDSVDTNLEELVVFSLLL